jgi:putative nucleotidyltransferase with HDIG domain
LPPAPTLLPELLELLQQPDVDAARIERLIKFDPTLTVSVLRLCNSAAFGSAKAVASLDEAILRLGFGQIFRLVVASCGAKSMSPTGSKHEAWQRQLWSHSVVSALGAQRIAQDQELDENLAFTAGLLHDIGKIIMLDVLEEKYARLLGEIREEGCTLTDAEHRLFGLQHAELGSRLLARWKFPLSLAAAVCFHHNPMAAGVHRSIAACVCFGTMIADLAGYGCNQARTPAFIRGDVFKLLKIEPGVEAKYVELIRELAAAIQALVQIPG